MRCDGSEITFLVLDGDITLDTAGRVRDRLKPLLEREGHVVLDLRGARLDSVGLGVLLSLQRHLELRERRLALISGEPGFLALLDRAGARAAVAVFTRADHAVEHVRAGEIAALAA